MIYLDDEINVVVVYPNRVGEAITKWRQEKGLPAIEVKELQYGMSELQRVVNPLRATLLTEDDATINGLLTHLSGTVDILWVISHGAQEGFFLNDGLVNASELTSLLRSADTFLCVLNTCESYETAHQIAWEMDVAILCTISEVPDRTAFISGALFARHLAAGLDYVTAWEKAKPGQEHPYQLFQARREMNPRVPSIPPIGRPLEETVYQLEQSVRDLQGIVRGSPDMGLKPLRQMVNEMASDISLIKDEMREIKKIQNERSRLNWWILIALVVIGLAVIWLVFQGGIS